MKADEHGNPDAERHRCMICKGWRRSSEGFSRGGTDWVCKGCNYGLEHGLDPLTADTHQRAFESRKHKIKKTGL